MTTDLSALPLEIRQPLAAAMQHCEDVHGILASPPVGGQLAKARRSVGLTGRDLGGVCDAISAWWKDSVGVGCAEGGGAGAGTPRRNWGEINPKVVCVEDVLL